MKIGILPHQEVSVNPIGEGRRRRGEGGGEKGEGRRGRGGEEKERERGLLLT